MDDVDDVDDGADAVADVAVEEDTVVVNDVGVDDAGGKGGMDGGVRCKGKGSVLCEINNSNLFFTPFLTVFVTGVVALDAAAAATVADVVADDADDADVVAASIISLLFDFCFCSSSLAYSIGVDGVSEDDADTDDDGDTVDSVDDVDAGVSVDVGVDSGWRLRILNMSCSIGILTCLSTSVTHAMAGDRLTSSSQGLSVLSSKISKPKT